MASPCTPSSARPVQPHMRSGESRSRLGAPPDRLFVVGEPMVPTWTPSFPTRPVHPHVRSGKTRSRLRAPPARLPEGHRYWPVSERVIVSLAICLDQHLRHLGTGELRRRQLAVRQHLAHLRAREEDVVVAAVRARLRRRHLPAYLAPEGVLEEHRLDVELVRLELVEDQLRVVRAVVAADARMVAADDEVRATVVLAADRMPDRLARAGVAHR